MRKWLSFLLIAIVVMSVVAVDTPRAAKADWRTRYGVNNYYGPWSPDVVSPYPYARRVGKGYIVPGPFIGPVIGSPATPFGTTGFLYSPRPYVRFFQTIQ